MPRFRALEPISVLADDAAGPQSFVLADVNKDGKPDLIVVDRTEQDEIAVYLGRGDGTFEAPQFYEVDGTPTAVAVADLSSPFASDTAGDIDGNPDIIVGDEDGSATLLLGRGDGGFDPPEQDFVDVLDASEVDGIVIADFDHNGRLDLAFLDLFDEVYFLCNVSGSFAPCFTDVVETTGMYPIAIAGGDFNGDLNADVAVLNGDSHDLSPIFGTGDGSFEPVAQRIPTSSDGDQEPRALAAGRLDGDTRDDLVVGNFEQFSDLALTALYGEAAGGFGHRSFTAPFSLAAVALADFNADAALDVLMITSGGNDHTAISFGDGAGGFGQPIAVAGFPAGEFRAVSIGDLDGDTKPDAAVLTADGSAIRVLLNETVSSCAGDCNGNGTVSIDELVLTVGIALGEQPFAMCAAVDIDGSNTVEINELVAAVLRALSGC